MSKPTAKILDAKKGLVEIHVPDGCDPGEYKLVIGDHIIMPVVIVKGPPPDPERASWEWYQALPGPTHWTKSVDHYHVVRCTNERVVDCLDDDGCYQFKWTEHPEEANCEECLKEKSR